MHKKLLTVLLPFLSLMVIPFVVQAATITICDFDECTYHQGDTGDIAVTIYNDKDDKIRVTELTATIDYYYTFGNVYLQNFFTDVALPVEIQEGQSSTFYIPFSLPTNIASGYTKVDVKAETERWDGEEWKESDDPRYQLRLYIESPYKQQLEEYQSQLEDYQRLIEEQRTINKNTTTMMYLLGATMLVCVAVVVFLFILNRRARAITQPTA